VATVATPSTAPGGSRPPSAIMPAMSSMSAVSTMIMARRRRGRAAARVAGLAALSASAGLARLAAARRAAAAAAGRMRWDVLPVSLVVGVLVDRGFGRGGAARVSALAGLSAASGPGLSRLATSTS